MLNLNLNIIGAGVGKNKSSYDPRLFMAMLEDFYTASLSANARLTVVVSGSAPYGEQRYYKTVITSSATPSTQKEFIVVGSDNYLVEQDSWVTASFQGFPKWDPVQFGDPSIFNNVTMSLEIPSVGYASSSYSTSSYFEHKFQVVPKGTYVINAKIIFGDYYNVTLNEHFFQSSSFQQQLQLTGSSTGFLTENAYTSSTTGLNNKINVAESGSVWIKQNGVGNWGIIHNVPLNPQYSQSLVTMSLETPYNGWTHTYGTSSVNSVSFSASQFTLNNNAAYNISASINVTNPYIPIDYIVVAAGQNGCGVPYDSCTGPGGTYTNDGGSGGEVLTGKIFISPLNAASITASVGLTSSIAVANPNTTSSLSYRDFNGILQKISNASTEYRRVRGGFCGYQLYDAFQWFDGGYYGMSGNATSSCTVYSSSIVPGNDGRGGNSSAAGGGISYTGSNGVVGLRWYDPNNSFIPSLTGSGIISQSLNGYKYIYFTQTGSLSYINFNLPSQSFYTPVSNVPTSSTIPLDWLLVGGGGAGGNNIGGGGGGGALLSGSYQISPSEFFNLSIKIGEGGNINGQAGFQGYPGGYSKFTGNLNWVANGGGGGIGGSGNIQAINLPELRVDNPGGGNGGGGAETTQFSGNYGVNPITNSNYKTGASGSKETNNPYEGIGGGGGGASTTAIQPKVQKPWNDLLGGAGGSGSIWLDGNYYAGGGGGGRNNQSFASASFGGIGGGGNGGTSDNVTPTTVIAPITGSSNTGGGGGGGAWGSNAAKGGSGVAAFRLLTSDYNLLNSSNNINISGSNSVYTSGSYTFIKILNNGVFTIFNSAT